MIWVIYLLITILCWGSYNLFFKALEGQINPFLALTMIGIAEAVVCIPFLFKDYLHSSSIIFSTKTILMTIFMGLLLSIGTVSFFQAFKIGASTSIAVPAFAIGAMIIGAIGGILFFHESISFNVILGLIFGTIGIILITSGGIK